MHTSITIRPAAREARFETPMALRRYGATLRARWRERQARRAAQALRRRALRYVDTQPQFAADLAAAAGCTLDELELQREWAR